MKKLFISAIIVAGLALGGVSSFAANDTKVNDTKASGRTEMKGSTQEMTLSGKITKIKGDSLIVRDDTGKVHKVIPAEPSELKHVKVGENVSIEMKNGRAVAIHKITGNSEMKGGSQGQGSKY
jgi:FtsP/CotA-like multicopper oxidase with cupredoxin domain